MIRVKKVESPEELRQAFEVREEVFVNEQKFELKDEFDEFEDESHHFLAFVDETPVGVSRWRRTEKGIKLERFAVLKSYRGKRIGKRLVETTVAHILNEVKERGTVLYLHAQLQAVPLYERHGFVKEGERFDELGVDHFKMTRTI